MTNELLDLGVPQNKILEEAKAFTTWEQLVNCSEIAREKEWKKSDVAIISLFWHFGRITAMMINGSKRFNIDPFLIGVTPLISVERTLASQDPEKWNAYFKNLYSNPTMVSTFINEAMGTGQLMSGHHPKFQRPFSGFDDPLEA